MKYLIWLALPLLLVLSSCKDRAERDEEKILEYLADNNLTAERTAEGVYYILENPGTGTQPTSLGDEVEVHYEGYLLDGSVFDSSYDRGQTATFALWQVIRGWQIGIPLFKEGGKGKLLIPSELGYGAQAVGDIPKNSVLIFDVELIDVK